MINKRIDELFEAIKNSNQYQEYLNIGEVMNQDEEINKLVSEIKTLQKKSVNLEYNNDDSYKEVDKLIDEKVKELNKRPLYQEYLRRMNNFNDMLSESSSNIEEYIYSKI